MKQKLLFLLTALCFGFISGVKADVVIPNPVYFNDFSSSEGLTQVGSGEFIDDIDPRFGKIYHNNPDKNTDPRNNYLKLPSDVLTHSGTTKEMTVGFWVNCKSTTEYFFCPLFSAYETTEQGKNNGLPMFMCQSRCLLQINAGDGYWSDFVDAQNDKGTDNATTVWLDDNKWHYYTVTLTTTKAIVYVDGEIKNSWTLDGSSEGQNITGFFTKAASGTYPNVCLGGNQAWGWGDKDPSYGFDDFAVYDAALSAEQIAQIISNKKESAEIIGETDCSTYYLTDMTEKMTLSPGESYHYRFVNHNNPTNAWAWNWVLPVYNTGNAEAEVVLRSDNWEDQANTNSGCWLRSNGEDDVWADYMNQMNGATVDMTVSYTFDKVIKVDCDITTSGDYSWKYTYTSDYTGSTRSFTGDVQVALSISNSWLEVIEEGFSEISVTIGANGYATFASPNALDLTKTNLPSGLKAYKAQAINSTSVRFEEFDQTVPANTGILFEGEPSETYNISVVASGDVVSGNLFHVNEGNGYIVPSYDEDKTEVYYFAMIKDSDPLTFGKFNPASYKYPSNKAYLTVAKNTGARLAVSFGEEDGFTGINAVEAAEAEDGALKDGKYLIGGKIVLVKNGVKYGANGQKLN